MFWIKITLEIIPNVQRCWATTTRGCWCGTCWKPRAQLLETMPRVQEKHATNHWTCEDWGGLMCRVPLFGGLFLNIINQKLGPNLLSGDVKVEDAMLVIYIRTYTYPPIRTMAKPLPCGFNISNPSVFNFLPSCGKCEHPNSAESLKHALVNFKVQTFRRDGWVIKITDVEGKIESARSNLLQSQHANLLQSQLLCCVSVRPSGAILEQPGSLAQFSFLNPFCMLRPCVSLYLRANCHNMLQAAFWCIWWVFRAIHFSIMFV